MLGRARHLLRRRGLRRQLQNLLEDGEQILEAARVSGGWLLVTERALYIRNEARPDVRKLPFTEVTTVKVEEYRGFLVLSVRLRDSTVDAVTVPRHSAHVVAAVRERTGAGDKNGASPTT